MCGICGIFSPRKNEPNQRPLLREMLNAIFHRGPDDEGIYLDEIVALAMRRLSIIDLESGQQPITNEDGRVVVVFNGEIYNYLELMQRLEQQGHRFSTVSDTEVIVHLYEEHGLDFVQHLRGMFGLALWDVSARRLVIARDRLGIKPLYYTTVNNKLIFASEIKAILLHPEVEAAVDLQGLSYFLSLKYAPSPHTMFENIQALPPGYMLICEPDGISERQYWDISFAQEAEITGSEGEHAERLEELLHEAVRLHLRSDVPFGAFLSGGIDSSTVVALMSHYLNEPVKTFSVGFAGDGEEFSELPYARMVAEHYKTDHHEILMTPHDLINLSEKVVWHLDQPIADQAALPTYMVSELASRHVKMVLTGEGGDELFAGYARYAGERFSPVFRLMPHHARRWIVWLSQLAPRARRMKLALYALSHADETTRLANWFPLFNADMKHDLLTDDVKMALGDITADAVFATHLARTDAEHGLNRMLYVDTKLWLVDDLLARGDKMTMAASIEGRVPLLDHRIVEFAASLPPSLKLKGLMRKYLLKQVASKLLPESIIKRKKQGFPMPVSVWFRNEALPFVRDVLAPATVRRRGLFNPSYIEGIIDDHVSGMADHGTLLWALINIELWQRLYIDNRVAVPSTIVS